MKKSCFQIKSQYQNIERNPMKKDSLDLISNISGFYFKFRGVDLNYSITQIIDQFKQNYVTTNV